MAGERVTIVDVARETGISVSSVSVALRGEPGVSEATRSLVLAAADRLGYQPDRRARGLRERRSRVVGVTLSLRQTFHAALVESLYAAAAGQGLDLVLSATTPGRDVTAAVDSLRHERCDAVLLVSPDVDARTLAELGSRQPTVVVGSDLTAPGVDTVRADDDAGMALLVHHLHERGHRTISFVDGGDAAMSATRREGYRRAMRAHGLDREIDVLPGDPSEDAGVRAAAALLRRQSPPSAVLAHNDMIATGLLLALRSAGVAVPEGLAVAGYDDTRLGALSSIALTTVSQDPARLAEEALLLAVARAGGSGVSGSGVSDAPGEAAVVVPPRIVIRSTT